MAAERPVEMGKVGKTCLEGDSGDLSILIFIISQEFLRLFKALPQNVLRESLTGLFKQQMNIAGRDAQFFGDSCRAQAVIGDMFRDCPQNCGKPSGAYSALLLKFARIALATEPESDQIDKMVADDLSSPLIAETERECSFQISKQQP